jgi:hypothetical protein
MNFPSLRQSKIRHQITLWFFVLRHQKTVEEISWLIFFYRVLIAGLCQRQSVCQSRFNKFGARLKDCPFYRMTCLVADGLYRVVRLADGEW